MPIVKNVKEQRKNVLFSIGTYNVRYSGVKLLMGRGCYKYTFNISRSQSYRKTIFETILSFIHDMNILQNQVHFLIRANKYIRFI